MTLVAAEGISIAFPDGTTAEDQTWTRIDDPEGYNYVTAVATRRGRPDEFSATSAGQATLDVKNRDGAWDPTNTGGPFYGNLLPLCQTKINFEHPIRHTFHDILTGYIDDYDHKRQGPRNATTQIKLNDGFDIMANAEASLDSSGVFYDAQHVDARIHAALDDIGWSTDLRRIATGNVNVQRIIYDASARALEIIQEAVDAEFPGVSNFFCDRSGYAAFSGRGIRFDPGSYPDWITTWRVGDSEACLADPTLLPIFDVNWSFGKDKLYNDVVCAPRLPAAGSAAFNVMANSRVQDAASIARYGRRSLSLLDLLTLDGTTTMQDGVTECKDFARYYRNNYKVPHQRITAIEFHGQMDDGETTPAGESGKLWDFILGVELNHIIEVTTVNPGGGGFSATPFFVEGISNQVGRLNNRVPNWVMNLDLSPKARYASYP